MKRLFWSTTILVVGLINCGSPQTVPTTKVPVVDTEIRMALEKFSDLAGRGDVQLFMSQFDKGADIMMVGSGNTQVFKGRAAVEVWLGQVFSGMRISFQMNRVDISNHGDTAWAFVEGTETARDLSGKVLGINPYRFTAVLVKRGDGWVWRLFHGSTPEKE
jgi:ketosteroid isomerase-like protein